MWKQDYFLLWKSREPTATYNASALQIPIVSQCTDQHANSSPASSQQLRGSYFKLIVLDNFNHQSQPHFIACAVNTHSLPCQVEHFLMMRWRTTTRRASPSLRITNASIHNVFIAVPPKKIAMSTAGAMRV